MNSFDDFLRYAEVRKGLRVPVTIQDLLCLEQTQIKVTAGERPKSGCCWSLSKGKSARTGNTPHKAFIEAFSKLENADKIQFYCECVQFLDRVNRSIYTYSIDLPNQPMVFETLILTKYHLMDYWSPCHVQLWSSPPLLSTRFSNKVVPYDLRNYIIRKSKHNGKYSTLALQSMIDIDSADTIRMGFKDQAEANKVHHYAKLIVLKAHQQKLLTMMGLHFKETEQFRALPTKLNYQQLSEQQPSQPSITHSIISPQIGNYLQSRKNWPGTNILLLNQKQNKPLTANQFYRPQAYEVQSAKGTAQMFRAKYREDSGMSTKQNSKDNSIEYSKNKTGQNAKQASYTGPRPPLPKSNKNVKPQVTSNSSKPGSAATIGTYRTANPPMDWGNISGVVSQTNGTEKRSDSRKKIGIFVRPGETKPGDEFKSGYGLNTFRIQSDQNSKLGLNQVGEMLHKQLVQGQKFVNQQYSRLDPTPSFLQKDIEKIQRQNVRRQSTEKLLKDEYNFINGVPTHPSRVQIQKEKYTSQKDTDKFEDQERLRLEKIEKQAEQDQKHDAIVQARKQLVNYQLQKSNHSSNQRNKSNKRPSPIPTLKHTHHNHKLSIASIFNRHRAPPRPKQQDEDS